MNTPLRRRRKFLRGAAEGDGMKQEEVRRDKAKRLRYKKAAASGLTTWEMQET